MKHNMNKIMPPYLFHVSPSYNTSKILQEGLKPLNKNIQEGLGLNHLNRVFLSKFSNPREMYLPEEKLEKKLSLFKIDTSYLDLNKCYPDDALYNAYGNDQLERDVIIKILPNMLNKCNHIKNDDDFWKCVEENDLSFIQLNNEWRGKPYLTIHAENINNAFNVGEMGYQGIIPPSSIEFIKDIYPLRY